MGTGPKSYPVVYDPSNGLQYSFESGYQGISVSASPAGSDTQVQFNSSDSLGASADLTWNDGTTTLSIGNVVLQGPTGLYIAASAHDGSSPIIIDAGNNSNSGASFDVVLGENITAGDSTLGINTGGVQDVSASVQIDSINRGLLLPRMTTTQKNAITSPAEGLLVYDTSLHALCVYNGSAWKTVTVS